MGQSYLSDPSYQEATQMSFADLFKKVCVFGGWGRGGGEDMGGGATSKGGAA